MNRLKQELYSLCRKQIENSISEIEMAIADRREAVANETKSSMGDKYETTREMLQQDINMNMERLGKTKTDLSVLDTIDPVIHYDTVSQGSLVSTTQGNFYIAISAGHIIIEGMKYYIISASSPIALVMKGKRMGETFIVNGKEYTIEEVL